MATIAGVYQMSHGQFCYMQPQYWNEVRANRSLRRDVPLDEDEGNFEKFARVERAFAKLREQVKQDRVDLLVVFGDDQMESFDFTNFPSFAVLVAEDYEGVLAHRHSSFGFGRVRTPQPDEAPPERVRLKGHSALATEILRGLMARGFDPAFCMDLPKPEKGIGHAFLRPADSLTGLSVPVVPIFVNCYYAPQATAQRCYEVGKAVSEIIEAFPEDLRVGIVGSGGLWHTPGAKEAYLDEAFDREFLSFVESGDAQGMATFFDAYEAPADDISQDVTVRGRGSTGMPSFGGPQGGTRECANWVAAAAAAEGWRGNVLDYVPAYASPVGLAFAYYEKP